jgi:hypothetical protein
MSAGPEPDDERSTLEWIVYIIGIIVGLPVMIFIMIARFNFLLAVLLYVVVIGGAYFMLVKGY